MLPSPLPAVNEQDAFAELPERAEWPRRHADLAESQMATIIGDNLRTVRKQRQLSLDQLAGIAGVSRAMLSQIELARSVPTVRVLWKIARALDISINALMNPGEATAVAVIGAQQTHALVSPNGALRARLLFPLGIPRRSEFFELVLAASAAASAESYAPGTLENLVVAEGSVDVAVDGHSHRLNRGDAIHFNADLPHRYRNLGDSDARLYRVITYAEIRCY